MYYATVDGSGVRDYIHVVDLAQCYAATDLAERELGWKAERSISDMTADTWRWQANNPAGY